MRKCYRNISRYISTPKYTVYSYLNLIILDNYIDGESLMSLISDIEEFKYLVPQSGLRMKIKKIVQEVFYS